MGSIKITLELEEAVVQRAITELLDPRFRSYGGALSFSGELLRAFERQVYHHVSHLFKDDGDISDRLVDGPAEETAHGGEGGGSHRERGGPERERRPRFSRAR